MTDIQDMGDVTETAPLAADEGSGEEAPLVMDEEEVRRDLARLEPPYIIVAGRPVHTDRRDRWAVTCPDVDAALAVARRAERRGYNCYTVRNPIAGPGQLYRRTRAGVRFRWRWGNPPLIEDVATYRHVIVDIDPSKAVERLQGEEREAARVEAREHAVAALGRCPIIATIVCSGRGVQAHVRIEQDAPFGSQEFAGVRELGDQLAKKLRAQVDERLVQVDNVQNPNRESRLVGTFNVKSGHIGYTISEPGGSVTDIWDYVPRQEIRAAAEFSSGQRHIDDYVRTLYPPPGPSARWWLESLARLDPNQCSVTMLSEPWQDRARRGCDGKGRVDPDKSQRMIKFAAGAIANTQRIEGVLGALLDPELTILNEHALKRGVDHERAAYRAMTKAISSVVNRFVGVDG